MYTRKYCKFIFMSMIYFLFFSLTLPSAFAANKCQTKTFDLGPCSGTITTCVTVSDNTAIVWVRIRANCGILGEYDWSGNIYNGPYMLKLPDGTAIQVHDPNYLPAETDIITNVIYDPPIESVEHPSEWTPLNYRIEYKDSVSLELTGILEKTIADSIPVLYTYKSPPQEKISESLVIALVQSFKYSDPSFKAMTIFPNPTTDKITISFNFLPVPDGYTSVIGNSLDYLKIYNTSGQIVYSEANVSYKQNKQINVKLLPPGTYIIEIGASDGAFIWSDDLCIIR